MKKHSYVNHKGHECIPLERYFISYRDALCSFVVKKDKEIQFLYELYV